MWTHTHTHMCIIYIMCFCTSHFFFLSFVLLNKHARAHMQDPNTHTHAHTQRQARRKASSACDAASGGQGQGRNSRESGTVVGGEWEDHMHFSSLWWERTPMHLIVTRRQEGKQKKKKKPFFIFTHLRSKSFCRFGMVHTNWSPNSSSSRLWLRGKRRRRRAAIVQLRSAAQALRGKQKADTVPSSGGGENCWASRNVWKPICLHSEAVGLVDEELMVITEPRWAFSLLSAF